MKKSKRFEDLNIYGRSFKVKKKSSIEAIKQLLYLKKILYENEQSFFIHEIIIQTQQRHLILKRRCVPSKSSPDTFKKK